MARCTKRKPHRSLVSSVFLAGWHLSRKTSNGVMEAAMIAPAAAAQRSVPAGALCGWGVMTTAYATTAAMTIVMGVLKVIRIRVSRQSC